jgi:cyanate lyase
VLSANPKTTDISLNTASIENLQNANRIRIRATLNTLVENGIPTDVKLYSYYDLLLQLGVQAEVLIEKELTL